MIISLVTLSVFVTATMAEAGPPRQSTNVDIHAILGNDKIFYSYFDCLMDKRPCSADVIRIKNGLAAAISNDCADCTDEQKRLTQIAGKYMAQRRPTEWNMLMNKYDPDNEHRVKMNEFINSEDS